LLAFYLMALEIGCFTLLAGWMAYGAVYRSSRGDRRFGDPARLVIMLFSLLLIYRDARIMYMDGSTDAKLVMPILGIAVCAFTALAARAYGRGARI
jgi:hypothetical protein